MSDPSPNGWAEWSRHVLMELKRLNESIEKMMNKIIENDKRIAAVDSRLSGREYVCKERGEQIRDLRKGIQKNNDKIMSHRLITAVISAITSLATAGLIAYFAMKGGS